MAKIVKKEYIKSTVVEISLDSIPTYIHEKGYLSHNCNICRRVYVDTDGVTPKVYTLSELQANGTNRGKKQAEWLAVIGATHPNCRGQLLTLPNGWGFDPGTTNLKYYHKNFLWSRDKNNIKIENKKEE